MMKKLLAAALALCLLTGGTALAACDVCGGDQQCDACLGMGFVMAKMYGSDEFVQIGCTGANCDDGVCTACVQEEQTAAPAPEPTSQPSPEPTPAPAPAAAQDDAEYEFICTPVEVQVRKMLNKSKLTITYGDLKKMTELKVGMATSDIILSDLAFMPNLTELEIEAKTLDLTGIGDHPSLSDLTITVRQPIENAQLLPTLEKLKSLALKGDGAVKSEKPYLGQLQGLKYLSINSKNLRDLSCITDLSGLETLYVTSETLTDITGISQLSKLSSLTLKCKNLKNADELALLPSLADIPDPYTLALNTDLSALLGRGLDGPRTRNIKPGTSRVYLFDEWYPEYCAEKGIDLSALCEKRGFDLQKLLDGMDELTAAANLAAMPTPTPVPLAGSHVFVDKTVEKAALKTLKKSEQDVVMEEELSQISWLFIPLEKDSIVLDDLAFMPNLKTLSLNSMNLSAREVDLAPIQACTKLEELKVYVETNDTVKNLQAAAALPLLRELGVGGGKLSDEEAAWIGQMPQLEKLTLRRLPITDISWISGNTALEELEITKTGITRADGLRNLQQLTVVTIDENAETPDMSFLLGRGIRTKVRMLDRPFDQWYETWGPKEEAVESDADDTQYAQTHSSGYHQNRGGGTY